MKKADASRKEINKMRKINRQPEENWYDSQTRMGKQQQHSTGINNTFN